MKNLVNIILACLIVAISSLGCVTADSQKRISAFSEAANLAINNTNNSFNIVETTYYELQLMKLVNSYDKNGSYNPKYIEPFLSPDQLESRIEVLNALLAYSEKLAQLAGDEQLKKFDQATIDMGNSLKDLNKTAVSTNILSSGACTSQEIDIFTSAVNALGRWFIEYKREKELKLVVEEMDVNVKNICELLIKDIGTLDSGLRNQLSRNYSDYLREADLFIQRNKDSMDPIQKRTEIKNLAYYAAQQKKSDAVLGATQDTLGKLMEAHGKLNEAFSDDTIEIDNLITQLRTDGKRIANFHKMLSENN